MRRRACVAIFALAVLTGAWLAARSWIDGLTAVEQIEGETGFSLPSDARIIAAHARVLSVTNSEGYDWLVESDTSLLPWAEANLSAELDGWENVGYLSELGIFSVPIVSSAKLGGAWRGVRRLGGAREVVLYLYLAENGKIGILSTLPPVRSVPAA